MQKMIAKSIMKTVIKEKIKAKIIEDVSFPSVERRRTSIKRLKSNERIMEIVAAVLHLSDMAFFQSLIKIHPVLDLPSYSQSQAL